MNTEQMHQTRLNGQLSQPEFIEQVELLLNTKVYLVGIVINGNSEVFKNL